MNLVSNTITFETVKQDRKNQRRRISLSVGAFVLVALILSYTLLTLEVWQSASFSIFFLGVAFFCLRQYSKAIDLANEASNRLSMAKMLAWLDDNHQDQDTRWAKQGYQKLIESIVYSLRENKSTADSTNNNDIDFTSNNPIDSTRNNDILELLKNALDKSKP